MVIIKLKHALKSLGEASSKECSKILTDASQKIKSDVKLSGARQKSITQQIIDTKKTLAEHLRQNFEDEREKRKVLSIYLSVRVVILYLSRFRRYFYF